MYNFEEQLARRMVRFNISKIEVDGEGQNGTTRVSVTRNGKSYLVWVKSKLTANSSATSEEQKTE